MTDSQNFETCYLCAGTGVRSDAPTMRGACNGCEGKGRRLKFAWHWRDVGNIAQVKDIPLARLREIGGKRAGALWDKRRAAVGDHPIPDFEALREAHGAEAARGLYWGSPALKALEVAGQHFLDQDNIALIRGTRDGAVEFGRLDAVSTFAVVKDGQWAERGEMGWFACVRDERDRLGWMREFNAMLDGLPPEAWVAIIDCHI